MALREAWWLNGGCVHIVADSPGQVKPGALSSIAVKVMSKVDGSSLAVPVDTKLTGGQSVDPTRIDKAPGVLKHTAVNERGKKAQLTLSTKSKRGADSQVLNINTLGGYDVTGHTGDEDFSGTICDFSKPFILKGSGGANVVLTFVPSSDTAGSMSYTGRVNNAPMTLSGKGTYTVDELHGRLTFKETGTVHQAGTATNTTVLTMTPSSTCGS